MHEVSPATWARRAITIPGLLVLWLVDLAALPLLVVAAVLADVVRGSRSFALVRFQLALAVLLSLHVAGLFLLLGAWLAGLAWGRKRERALDARGEAWFARTAWRAAVRLFGMRVTVEGEELLDRAGPVVVMSRHASLLDVLLPIVFVCGGGGQTARFVAKRELLWDPCIDLVGHRLMTAFVERGGRAHEADIGKVESLADGLGTRDAVVIFPEGTRYSETKRAHALAAFAKHDDDSYARALGLRHLLPPRLDGPLGVLAHSGAADVVFCAHSGLEDARDLRDLVTGALVGRHVQIRFWRVPAREIPTSRELQVDWLWSWWECLDGWIDDAHGRAT